MKINLLSISTLEGFYFSIFEIETADRSSSLFSILIESIEVCYIDFLYFEFWYNWYRNWRDR